LHFDFGDTADEGFAEIVALSCVSWYLEYIYRIRTQKLTATVAMLVN
jgi:hypothetical protein